MFLSRADIRRIARRDVIPVFSGRDGCLEAWPDCCIPWYAPREFGQSGRYPHYSEELLAVVEKDLKAGARNVDISVTHDLDMAGVTAIRKILGLSLSRGGQRKPKHRLVA